jgi:energy-coupling factor transporter ATP-binding protein EcfA2
VVKSFGHVEVLREVDFSARAGEVTALIGDNGAGKSTLIKILSGALQRDGGEVPLDGEPVRMASPNRARELGIETSTRTSRWPRNSGRLRTPSPGGNCCARAWPAVSGCWTRRPCGPAPRRRSPPWAPT